MLWNVKNEGLFNPSSTGNPDVQDRPSPSIGGPIRLIVCSFFFDYLESEIYNSVRKSASL